MPKLKYFKLTKKNILSSPSKNGVYIFLDRKKKIVYVGKSIKLNERLKSYLTTPLGKKTKLMISEASFFSFTVVNSELEALLLEAHLVKLYKPKYNIQLKDDKHPLYIKITNDKYPKVLTVRKKETSEYSAVYFGPFPSSQNVHSVLKTLRRIFPFSTHKIGKRVCFYNQIGLCNPCPNVIENSPNRQKILLTKTYKKSITNIKKFLNGKLKKVKNSLIKEMILSSKKQDYEKSEKIKQQINKLDYITQPITSANYFLSNPNFVQDVRNNELLQLKNLLKYYFKNLKVNRIECYDIAHLSGVSPAASMVTFVNAEPEKTLYRHFKVNQKNSKSDTDSLSEIGKRREKHFPSWGIPDLIIIDGGKGQVSSFLDITVKHNIPVIGIAKQNETLIIPITSKGKKEYKQLFLPKGLVLNLIQRIRSEAHRFARRYHYHMLKTKLAL